MASRPIVIDNMAPSRFKKDPREKREVTPFNEDPLTPVAPPEIPAEWRDIEAPVNFTWVVQDELAGMGWPKSRDQVNFCLKQGIDHLITLAADKIPPHYAFPQLKWTMIPVEDFTGPSIVDIKKFIQIMAEARRDGEAVGVHCAEGRGRTGVICACYLIYYYDMEPWDAIRIMRRQRPGSVERKVQEETVVMFYDLLNDFGGLDNLEEREKEYKRLQQRKKLENELMICPYTAILSQGAVNKYKVAQVKQERMRRSRSMPKMNDEIDESIKQETIFQEHINQFYSETPKRCKTSRENSRPPLDKNQKDEENLENLNNRYDRGTTPGTAGTTGTGKQDRDEMRKNLKPAPRKSDVVDINNEPKHDLRLHFKDFMSTNPSNMCKRARSFSQPRDKRNSTDRDSQQLQNNSKCPESPLVGERKNLSKQNEAVEKGVSDRVQSEKLNVSTTTSTASNNNTTTNGYGVYDMCARSRVMVTSFDDDDTTNNTSLPREASNSDDKPVYDEYPDNREIEDTSSRSSNLRRGSTVSRNNSVGSENCCSKVPPKPKYIPASIQDSAGSSTSSYYARVRTRAEVTRRRESGKNEAGATGSSTSVDGPVFDLPKAPSSAVMSRKFESNIYRKEHRQRSRTTEIDYVSPPSSTTTATCMPSSTSTSSITSSNVTIMTSTSDEAADHEVETIFSEPLGTSKQSQFPIKSNNNNNNYATGKGNNTCVSPTAILVTPPPSTSSPAILKNNNVPKKVESRTSSDCSLKVENSSELGGGNKPTGKGRLSPFNRFRTSLVSGSSSTTNSILASSPLKTSPAASMFGGSSSASRQRTESTSTPTMENTKNSGEKPEKKGRFFYRKSRTGPLALDEAGSTSSPGTSSPASTSASNSVTNLSGVAGNGNTNCSTPPINENSSHTNHYNRSQKNTGLERPLDRLHIRAKSEFNPRTAATSASAQATCADAVAAVSAENSSANHETSVTSRGTTEVYGGLAMKDNYFLAAAKKWASYDKPSYETPFSRSNWKRSHRKFNYSRFLNYTRETFV